MLRLTKTLNLIFGYRWSVCFCEGDDKPKYVLHGDSAMQLLFHVGCMWEDKELHEPWRIYLRFNKTGRMRELCRQDFEKELSPVSGMSVNGSIQWTLVSGHLTLTWPLSKPVPGENYRSGRGTLTSQVRRVRRHAPISWKASPERATPRRGRFSSSTTWKT